MTTQRYILKKKNTRMTPAVARKPRDAAVNFDSYGQQAHMFVSFEAYFSMTAKIQCKYIWAKNEFHATKKPFNKSL